MNTSYYGINYECTHAHVIKKLINNLINLILESIYLTYPIPMT